MLQSCDKVVLYAHIIMYLVYSHSVAMVIDILLSGRLKWSLEINYPLWSESREGGRHFDLSMMKQHHAAPSPNFL